MYEELFRWAISKPFSFEVKNLFFMALHRDTNEGSQSKLLLCQAIKNPGIIFSAFFIKKLHLIYFNSLKK
jgi:hypothetical protein